MGLLSCGGPIFLLLPHRRNDIIWKINFKPQSWSLCAPFFIKSKLYFSTTLYCLILRCRAPFGHHRTKFLYALLIGRAPQVRHHGHHFAELRPQSEQHAKKKSLETIEAQGICGGSGGIRTHVPLRTTWFRVVGRQCPTVNFVFPCERFRTPQLLDFTGAAAFLHANSDGCGFAGPKQIFRKTVSVVLAGNRVDYVQSYFSPCRKRSI